MIWIFVLLEFAFAGLAVYLSPWWLVGFAISCSIVVALMCHHEKHMKKYYEKLDAHNNKLDTSICNAIEILKEYRETLAQDTAEVQKLKNEFAAKLK